MISLASPLVGMGCPHGQHSDPKRCSQCLGVKARVVRYDDTDRIVKVDGVPTRSLMPEPKPLRHNQPVYSGHQIKRCGRCGQMGHNQRGCTVSAATGLPDE